MGSPIFNAGRTQIMQMLWNANAQNKKFVASYSGGKDSSLALFKAMQMGEAVV